MHGGKQKIQPLTSSANAHRDKLLYFFLPRKNQKHLKSCCDAVIDRILFINVVILVSLHVVGVEVPS